MPNILSPNWDQEKERCDLHPKCHRLPCVACIAEHQEDVVVELTAEEDRALNSPVEVEKRSFFANFPPSDQNWLAERAI